MVLPLELSFGSDIIMPYTVARLPLSESKSLRKAELYKQGYKMPIRNDRHRNIIHDKRDFLHKCRTIRIKRTVKRIGSKTNRPLSANPAMIEKTIPNKNSPAKQTRGRFLKNL